MQRAEGEGAEAGSSQPRARDGSGVPVGKMGDRLAADEKTRKPNQDGVRRKKKRTPANGATESSPASAPIRQRQSGMPERDRERDRDRAVNINPALRPYLATAPKPVSSLTRTALDEAVPLRQSPRQDLSSNIGAPSPGQSGLILPSTFLRSQSSLNLSINEPSATGASNANAAAGPGRGSGAGANGTGDSGVALTPVVSAPGRMYAAGLVAPPLIVPAGSSAAMRQAQAQGRPAIQPTAAAERSRAGPARRRERAGNRAERSTENGRRRSTEDLRRQHPNNSSTSLTLLPGSSTLMRIPEDGSADAGATGGRAAAAPAAGGGRRTRANEQLRRRPTVSSREEGRALGLARGASMRRVNVWDDVSNVDEGEMEEPPPPFPFPPASGASPTARTGAGAPGQSQSAIGETAPPDFVADSRPQEESDRGGTATIVVPDSPPPSFAQATGLEPLPHSLTPLQTSRRGSVRSQAHSTRAPSPSPTVYQSAPSSPVASEDESEGDTETALESSTSARLCAERMAWEEDIRAGLELDERVRRELSRRRRRGEVDEVEEGAAEDEQLVVGMSSQVEAGHVNDGEEIAEPESLPSVGSPAESIQPSAESANIPAENVEPANEPVIEQERSLSLMTEPASSPINNLATTNANAFESRPQTPIAKATPSSMDSADEPVLAGPSRTLTRGKAIRRSSSGYGTILTESDRTSPNIARESPSARIGSRRQSQALPTLSNQASPAVSPRLPLFGDTGFDWRPASVHLADGTIPPGDSRALVKAEQSTETAPAPLSPPLLQRSAQRASIDFASVGPGRRVDDPTPPPPDVPEQKDATSPPRSRAGSVLSPSGSRFHEMPRRSTESDILPHRQAALKRRELFTAASTADASMPEQGLVRAIPTSPVSPARRMVDELPSGPLVDFSDYEPHYTSRIYGASGGDKGKGRLDNNSVSTGSMSSGSLRSRPLMPLPPELVALFHEEIPEEAEDEEEGEEDGEEEGDDALDGTMSSGTKRDLDETGEDEPQAPPSPAVHQNETSKPPRLKLDTEKTLPMLPPRPTEGTDDNTTRKRAPPPPPPLKRHLVSTTVGANLAPRRSIIRTADTPVTPRPIRQLGMPSMRRPPPPPPRPVSQHLQDTLEAQVPQKADVLQGGSALSEEERQVGQTELQSRRTEGLLGRRDSRGETGVTARDHQSIPASRSPASVPAIPRTEQHQQRPSIPSLGTTPVASVRNPTPPPLPPRPFMARPAYDREDSLVSSADSVQSDPTTLSRLAPIPDYKPAVLARPRGPRPRPPPIPSRPWIKVVTDDVEISTAISAGDAEQSRPSAERSQSDNSVRTMPNPPPESPSSMSTVRAPTRRSTSERDLRGAANGNDTASSRSPRSPRASNVRQQSMEYTDLDLLVSRLEGSGREYEASQGFTQISAFLGPGKAPAASANAIATLLPGLVSVDSRRVTKDGKVKLKLSLLGVRVAKCPICLAQFKKDERGVILPECGHHAHEACARKWFKEDGRCFVCREPLVEEVQGQGQGQGQEGRARGSRMVEGVV